MLWGTSGLYCWCVSIQASKYLIDYFRIAPRTPLPYVDTGSLYSDTAAEGNIPKSAHEFEPGRPPAHCV